MTQAQRRALVRVRHTSYLIKNLDDIFDIDLTIEQIRVLEQNRDLLLEIPDSVSSLTEKTKYKVSFLKHFLKLIYRDKKMPEIYEIIRDRYQVFLSDRQLTRITAKENLKNTIKKES